MAQASDVFSGRTQYTLVVTVTQTSQDIPDNQSTVSVQLRIDETTEWGSWSNIPLTWNYNVAGQSGSGSRTYDFRDYDSLILYSGSKTITHNSDGTKTFSFSGSVGGGTTIGSASASSSMTLTTIPRASTPTISGGSSFSAGATITINTNRASTSFTHTIQYWFGTTGWVTIATGVGASTSWAVPMSLLSQIPNALTGTGSIRCITYSGSTNIGNVVIGFTLGTPPSAGPTWTSVSESDSNTVASSVVGQYVQNVSKLSFAINGAAGQYGASITLRRFQAESQIMDATTGTLPNTISGSGTIATKFTIQDSRGLSKVQTTNITVLPYSAPLPTSFLARRCQSDGTVDQENGTYLRVDLNASIQSLINGTEKNSMAIRIYSRVRGTTTWTLQKTLSPSGLTYNSNVVIPGPFVISSAYDIRAEISDLFNTSAAQTTISVASIFMHWSTGLAIGKYWEQGMLDVNGDIYASGRGRFLVRHVSDATATGRAYFGTGEAALGTDQIYIGLSPDSDGTAPEALWVQSVDNGWLFKVYKDGHIASGAGGTPWVMAAGEVTLTVASGATGSATVTFPSGRFSVPPIVTAIVRSADPSHRAWSVTDATTTGFTVYLTNSSGGSVTNSIGWTAVQMTSTSASG